MRSSRAEITIEEILTMAGIDFKEEFTFSDLISTSGRPLRFDFCIFDDDGEIDFLIENNTIFQVQNMVDQKDYTNKSIMTI